MTTFRSLAAGVLSAAALALVAVPASAQQVEQLKLTNGGGVTWDWPGSGAGTVGPYQAQVMSVPGQPTIDVFCVDFQHTVSVGQTWNALYSNVMGDLSQTRAGVQFGEATARTMYQQAAFLTTRFAGASADEQRGIQSAIWNIFHGGAPDHAQASAWRTLAESDYLTAGLDYSTFAVLTDTRFTDSLDPTRGTQELLTGVPPTVVPEPSTYLLMSTGLVAIAGIARRRRRTLQDG
jgi:hypothetical protein